MKTRSSKLIGTPSKSSFHLQSFYHRDGSLGTSHNPHISTILFWDPFILELHQMLPHDLQPAYIANIIEVIRVQSIAELQCPPKDTSSDGIWLRRLIKPLAALVKHGMCQWDQVKPSKHIPSSNNWNMIITFASLSHFQHPSPAFYLLK